MQVCADCMQVLHTSARTKCKFYITLSAKNTLNNGYFLNFETSQVQYYTQLLHASRVHNLHASNNLYNKLTLPSF